MFYQFHMSIEEDISGKEYLTVMMFPEIGGKKNLKSYQWSLDPQAWQAESEWRWVWWLAGDS